MGIGVEAVVRGSNKLMRDLNGRVAHAWHEPMPGLFGGLVHDGSLTDLP